MPRKAGKSGVIKGETITIRVPPQIKFALELSARKKHCSISSVVLNLVESYIKKKESGLIAEKDRFGNRVDLIKAAWDPSEPDRLVKLAMVDDSFLTYDEEFIWKVIKEKSSYGIKELDPNFQKIRADWKKICEEAKVFQDKYGSV